MAHEGRLRRGPKSSYRMAKEARAPPGGTGSTGGPRARKESMAIDASSARARHERERCEERPKARKSRNDTRITNGAKENRASAGASPGDIKSNQADRDPRLREALSSSGRRM